MKALGEYKKENVRVAKSLVVLNISQAFVICCGLTGCLFLAYTKIMGGTLMIGDYVMINTYILQMYAPLGFLGTFWRWIRQAMTDVEMVFELMENDDKIKEVENPV